MKNKLAASPKLKGALAYIMSEAFEIGYIPSLNKTDSERLCVILSNTDSGKCALLGTLKDDDESVIACTVDVKQWLWADTEGFTLNDITDCPDLSSRVFKWVPAEALPWILA